MIKPILFASCVLSFMTAFPVQANETDTINKDNTSIENELFPELTQSKKEIEETSPSDTEDFDLFKKNMETDDEQTVETIKTPKLQPTLKTEENTNESKNQFFKITPTNMKRIVPPTGIRHQMCYGNLTLSNTTKYVLKELRLTLAYGGVDVPYYFTNVQPQQYMTGTLAMAGPMCDDLTKEVSINIEKCDVDGISSDACKGYVKYSLE